MTVELDKGSTFYDHRLIARIERYPTPLRDLQERDMDDAADYLAARLRGMDDFRMTEEVAKHHVYRLHQRAEY